MAHLERHSLLFEYQLGFRPNHSTELAVTYFTGGRFSSAGLLQTKSRRTINLLFRFLVIVLKYSQKLFAMKLLSVDFDLFIINAEPCSKGNLVG